MIIFGNDDFDGILSICDGRENFSNKLKKSSIEAFRLFFLLLTESSIYLNLMI